MNNKGSSGTKKEKIKRSITNRERSGGRTRKKRREK